VARDIHNRDGEVERGAVERRRLLDRDSGDDIVAGVWAAVSTAALAKVLL
jgi:hypothetical protein